MSHDWYLQSRGLSGDTCIMHIKERFPFQIWRVECEASARGLTAHEAIRFYTYLSLVSFTQAPATFLQVTQNLLDKYRPLLKVISKDTSEP